MVMAWSYKNKYILLSPEYVRGQHVSLTAPTRKFFHNQRQEQIVQKAEESLHDRSSTSAVDKDN